MRCGALRSDTSTSPAPKAAHSSTRARRARERHISKCYAESFRLNDSPDAPVGSLIECQSPLLPASTAELLGVEGSVALQGSRSLRGGLACSQSRTLGHSA